MSLTKIVEKENLVVPKNRRLYQEKLSVECTEKTNQYRLFSEQYLEKPVISGDYEMALTPTACTIKFIPVIDDF